ncbi:MAG: replication factor C large subunit [Haloferacaceae archaeon]
MTDWTEKHRPTSLAEVRGNDEARDALREWAETWDDHREAAVLHGAPGVGKTSAAHALANDMGWETVELNASDTRTADVIERFAGRAARNATLDGAARGGGGRQLVIVDEADNLHGTHDRGGARALTDLVKEADQPVVLIANDYYEMSRGLRSATREIEFRDVSARSILPVLRDVCRREGVEFDEAALERIAEADSGDLRSAVRDLQAAAEGNDRVTVEDVVTDERDRTLGIFEFLDAVLKQASPEEALSAAYDTDETPDDLVQWVEHNLPKVYEGPELARAYRALADADRWLGRVYATQNYSYWRYATDGLAAGVAAARDGTKGGWTRFGRPQFWSTSSDAAESVVRAVATANGTSMSTARREILPFLSALTHHCKPRDLTVAMAAYYDLDESQVAFVTGSGESTNKVESIVADARERRAETMADHAGGAFVPGDDSDADGDDGNGSDVDADADTDEGDDGSGLAGFLDDGEAEPAGDRGGDGGDDGDDADDADDGPAVEERAREAESDDGQSGLGDFT